MADKLRLDYPLYKRAYTKLASVYRKQIATPTMRPDRLLAARLGLCPLPDFLIIGARKAGTTSFYAHLTQHPQVKRGLRKEIRFFTTNYQRGLTWYKAHFPVRREGDDFITGEATVNYLFYPHTASRAFATVPNAKIFVILKNPIDRTYSDYFHAIRYNWIDMSFEDALEHEQAIIERERRLVEGNPNYSPKAFLNYSFVSQGIYVQQLKNWFQYFPREQFLIIKFENLISDRPEIFMKVQNFLGIPPVELGQFPQKNKGIYSTPMEEGTRKKLRAIFEPYNAELGELLQMDFSDWD